MQNGITNLPSGTFDGLLQLQTLDLSQNSIQVVPVGVFNTLPALVRIELSNNNVLGFIEAGAFNGLSQLASLSVVNTALMCIPADGLPVNPSDIEVCQECRDGELECEVVAPSGTNCDSCTFLTRIVPDGTRVLEDAQQCFACTFVRLDSSLQIGELGTVFRDGSAFASLTHLELAMANLKLESLVQ
eukprot:1286759-Rhodomonas_salina.1